MFWLFFLLICSSEGLLSLEPISIPQEMQEDWNLYTDMRTAIFMDTYRIYDQEEGHVYVDIYEVPTHKRRNPANPSNLDGYLYDTQHSFYNISPEYLDKYKVFQRHIPELYIHLKKIHCVDRMLTMCQYMMDKSTVPNFGHRKALSQDINTLEAALTELQDTKNDEDYILKESKDALESIQDLAAQLENLINLALLNASSGNNRFNRNEDLMAKLTGLRFKLNMMQKLIFADKRRLYMPDGSPYPSFGDGNFI